MSFIKTANTRAFLFEHSSIDASKDLGKVSAKVCLRAKDGIRVIRVIKLRRRSAIKSERLIFHRIVLIRPTEIDIARRTGFRSARSTTLGASAHKQFDTRSLDPPSFGYVQSILAMFPISSRVFLIYNINSSSEHPFSSISEGEELTLKRSAQPVRFKKNRPMHDYSSTSESIRISLALVGPGDQIFRTHVSRYQIIIFDVWTPPFSSPSFPPRALLANPFGSCLTSTNYFESQLGYFGTDRII